MRASLIDWMHAPHGSMYGNFSQCCYKRSSHLEFKMCLESTYFQMEAWSIVQIWAWKGSEWTSCIWKAFVLSVSCFGWPLYGIVWIMPLSAAASISRSRAWGKRQPGKCSTSSLWRGRAIFSASGPDLAQALQSLSWPQTQGLLLCNQDASAWSEDEGNKPWMVFHICWSTWRQHKPTESCL